MLPVPIRESGPSGCDVDCAYHPWALEGFPLLRNFYVRTHVNKTEVMYEVSRVNVIRVEPCSTRVNFHSRVIFTCVRALMK